MFMEMMAFRIMLTGIAVCVALLIPGSAMAAPGDLDPTFGGDGLLTVDLDDGVSSEFHDVLVQPDGRIVGIGGRVNEEFDPGVIDSPADSVNSAVARYDPDGSPDTSFGGDGVVAPELVPEEPFAGYEIAQAGALQPDGKIVIVAHAFTDYKVARLNPDGSLDDSFAGDGRTTIPIGSESGLGTFVSDVALTANGKIVIVGNAGKRAGVVRLAPDGRLDRRFSSDGKAFVPHTYGFATALDRKGRILVGGTRDNRPRGSAGQPAEGTSITRLKRNGSIDRSFAGDGVVTVLRSIAGSTGVARAVEVQPNGRIVVAGTHHADFVVARVTRRGRLDDSFSGNGRAITDFALDEAATRPESADSADALAVGPRGAISVAGTAHGRVDIGEAAALARYKRNGKLDRRFNGDGRRLLRVGSGPQSCAAWSGIATQGDDLVVAGEARCDINARTAVVARFHG